MTRLVLELAPPESRHYGSFGERVAAVCRYSRPDEIHAVAEKAHALGASAIMAVFDPATRAGLADFRRWRDTEIWAVVPNMFTFIRDLTDLGMVGAARRRFGALGPAAMLRLGLMAMGRVKGVLTREFVTGALVVAEMELAGLRGLPLARAVLHPQLTELALAGGISELFEAFAERARQHGLGSAVLTRNPLRTAEVLGSPSERLGPVIAPCNPRGYKMSPERGRCEALYASAPEAYLASQVTASGQVPLQHALKHVADLGLGGAVLSPGDVEAAYPELAKVS